MGPEAHTSVHRARVIWAAGADDVRAHTVELAGQQLAASGAAVLGGDPDKVDPEEMFVASLSSCHMLWFLALARAGRLEVASYEDEPEGTMDGSKFIGVVLRPRVTFDGEDVDDERLASLHRRAHERCFIANSVSCPVEVEPWIGTARVRRARDGDASSIAAIHVRSWQAAYRGVLPDRLLDGLSVPEREAAWRTLRGEGEDRWLTIVAAGELEGLVGFCSVATPSRDEGADPLTAEVGALYVDPGHWRQGAGGALLKTALDELGKRCFREVTLWVLPENRAALAFYARFGFEIEEGVEKREERSGRPVVRLRASLTPASSR